MIFSSIIPNYCKNHIIQCLSDIDLYKLTMLQFILHNFSYATAKYKFKNRTKNVNLAKYVDEINREVDHLCTLKFEDFELDFIKTLPFFTVDFIYFLKLFRLNREWIKIYVENGELVIETKEAPMLYVMMFEIYILAITEEVYTRNEYKDLDLSEGRKRLQNKIDMILNFVNTTGKPFPMADFGTRRRFSLLWQEEVISNLSEKLPKNVFIGTSNVLFANLYHIKPIGTMAHEIFQAGQAFTRPIDSQKLILDLWAKEFNGNLSIALTDTLGFDKFLKDFNLYYAKLYDGGRHDSADPFKWGDKFISHYESFLIDPMTKIAAFSDGLTIPKSIELANYFYNRIKYLFGIGTNLTNDVGIDPLQLVMKIVMCMGRHVAKKSDSIGKGMCESKEYDDNLTREIELDLKNKY
jgi:nicotinate phosphoribosyltransferase